MFNFISKIGITLLLGVSSLLGHFGYSVVSHDVLNDLSNQAPVSTPMVGAVVPVTTSFYTDSLQSGITQTQTSFTLVKGKDGQGVNLSGQYGFVIDQGSAAQEIVNCTTVSNVNVSGCTRGVDLTNGTSTVLALEQPHNRGATVQITTAPVVNIMANILRGVESINQPIYYANDLTQAQWNAISTTSIPDIAFVNRLLTSGCANSTESVDGCSQLATGIQAASSTVNGSSSARLVIPASLATSTRGNATSLNAVITKNDGRIDSSFLDGTGVGNQYTFNATTTNTTGIVTKNLIVTASSSVAASSANPLSLNAIPYSFPTSQGTSNSTFINNGSGTLSWSVPSNNQYATTSLQGLSVSNSSVSSSVLVIPSSIWTASSTVVANGSFTCGTGNATCSVSLEDSAGDVFITTNLSPSSSGATVFETFSITMQANGISSQYTLLTGINNTNIVAGGLYPSDASGHNVSAINLAGVTGLKMVLTSNSSLVTTAMSQFNIIVRP